MTRVGSSNQIVQALIAAGLVEDTDDLIRALEAGRPLGEAAEIFIEAGLLAVLHHHARSGRLVGAEIRGVTFRYELDGSPVDIPLALLSDGGNNAVTEFVGYYMTLIASGTAPDFDASQVLNGSAEAMVAAGLGDGRMPVIGHA